MADNNGGRPMSAAIHVTDGVDWSSHYRELVDSGYEPVEEFTFRGRTLRPGMRVAHKGERYHEAYRDGTAVLAAILRHPPGQWEKEWGRPDVEVIAITDRDRFGTGRIGRWADYHCTIADNQPEAVAQ